MKKPCAFVDSKCNILTDLTCELSSYHKILPLGSVLIFSDFTFITTDDAVTFIGPEATLAYFEAILTLLHIRSVTSLSRVIL
jgi:hypothetical protein